MSEEKDNQLQQGSTPSVEPGQARPVSERKRQANRENAKKSTGPKTVRGKAYSRGNALKHGLLATSLLFRPDGTPINPELHALWEGLQEKYGKGDVRTDLLVESVVVECYRQQKALDCELECYQQPKGHFSPNGNLPNLQRYRSASQRALEKNLELLEKLPSVAAADETQPDDAEPAADQKPAATGELAEAA